MKILIASPDANLIHLIQNALKRFDYQWEVASNGVELLQRLIASKSALLVSEFSLPEMNAVEVFRRMQSLEKLDVPPAIVLTRSEDERVSFEREHFSRAHIFSVPVSTRTLVAAVQRILASENQIVSLGGGTGLFTLLSGLKTLPGLSLTSIVSMSDDGGSTGVLRDMFGILPPGDIRRSLVALSTAPDLVNQLIQYRFEKGEGLQGHSVGNLLLTALSQMRGSMALAVRSLGEILNIQGRVIPVTESINTLKAELEDGAILEGEHRIDLFHAVDRPSRIKRIWQEPETYANADALEAIYNAQYIILGPGDLFTSVISNLIVKGISEAIATTRAKKIYICNVMTKPGETHNFQAGDHVEEILKYLESDVLDYVICSNTKFDEAQLAAYAGQKQVPVGEDNPGRLAELTNAEIIWADVACNQTLLRHDSLKLAAQIEWILSRESEGLKGAG